MLTGVIGEGTPFTIDDLPYGAECDTAESADARFATSYSSTQGEISSDVTITTEPSIVDVLNQTGSFHVDIGTLVSSARPFDPDDEFTFIVTCSNNDEVIYEATVDATTEDGAFRFEAALLPTGTTCETTLDSPSEWNTVSAMGEQSTEMAITQTIGTDIAWNAFEVERATASLPINKELAGLPADTDFTTEEFAIDVTCVGGFIDAEHQLTEDLLVSTTDPLIVPELPVGSECTVVEQASDLFDDSYSTSPTFVVSAGDSDNALIITNTATDSLLSSLEPDAPPLAFTGSTVWPLVWFAILLLLAGVLIIGPRRRRDEIEA